MRRWRKFCPEAICRGWHVFPKSRTSKAAFVVDALKGCPDSCLPACCVSAHLSTQQQCTAGTERGNARWIPCSSHYWQNAECQKLYEHELWVTSESIKGSLALGLSGVHREELRWSTCDPKQQIHGIHWGEDAQASKTANQITPGQKRIQRASVSSAQRPQFFLTLLEELSSASSPGWESAVEQPGKSQTAQETESSEAWAARD